MGYDAKFTIVGEIEDRFKPMLKTVENGLLYEYKTLLIGACMKQRKETDTMDKIYKDIVFYLRMYIVTLSENWKILNQDTLKEGNEYDVYGYKYSKNYSEYKWTLNELEEHTIKELFLAAITETKGRYEADTNYHSKLEDVETTVNDLEESVNEIWSLDFFNTYKDKEGSNFEESY